jgi:hypothetical protein
MHNQAGEFNEAGQHTNPQPPPPPTSAPPSCVAAARGKQPTHCPMLQRTSITTYEGTARSETVEATAPPVHPRLSAFVAPSGSQGRLTELSHARPYSPNNAPNAWLLLQYASSTPSPSQQNEPTPRMQPGSTLQTNNAANQPSTASALETDSRQHCQRHSTTKSQTPAPHWQQPPRFQRHFTHDQALATVVPVF